MARVHEHVKQAGEIMFVYSSSSLDDFNNPMFILSTSSAAGGLPLRGEVVKPGTMEIETEMEIEMKWKWKCKLTRSAVVACGTSALKVAVPIEFCYRSV